MLNKYLLVIEMIIFDHIKMIIFSGFVLGNDLCPSMKRSRPRQGHHLLPPGPGPGPPLDLARSSSSPQEKRLELGPNGGSSGVIQRGFINGNSRILKWRYLGIFSDPQIDGKYWTSPLNFRRDLHGFTFPIFSIYLGMTIYKAYVRARYIPPEYGLKYGTNVPPC